MKLVRSDDPMPAGPPATADDIRASLLGRALLDLREYLTPEIEQLFTSRQEPRLLAVFALLRRLRPGDLRNAMLCHRVLLLQARRDMRAMGFIDPDWADLPRLVFNVIDGQGYRWQYGRWVPE